MSINVSSPITGLAQTGLTSPTYTVVTDVAPTVNAKQVAVTALGGTQAGVTISSVSSPFTMNFVRPTTLAALPPPNPVTGVYPTIPNNTYQFITRKGVTPAANQGARTMTIRTIIDVPAGSDTYDSPNVRAGLSAHFGYVSQQSSGIGDTATSGVM